jgi:hypothetical protein
MLNQDLGTTMFSSCFRSIPSDPLTSFFELQRMCFEHDYDTSAKTYFESDGSLSKSSHAILERIGDIWRIPKGLAIIKLKLINNSQFKLFISGYVKGSVSISTLTQLFKRACIFLSKYSLNLQEVTFS